MDDAPRGLMDGRGTDSPDRPPRLLLVDVDPYLCHVVRQRLGTLEITEVPPDAEPAWFLELIEEDTGAPTIVLVDTSSPRLGQVLLVRRHARLVGCASRDADPWVTEDLDAILTRPFSADEVEHLVRRILASHLAPGPESGPVGPRWAAWMARRTGLVYVAATLLAAPLELATGRPTRWLLLVAVLAYTSARAWWRPPRRPVIDIGVVSAALFVTGGPASSYVPLAFAVTVHAGLGGSLATSTRAAMVVALSAIAVPPTWTGDSRAAALASYVVVFPAIAAATAQSVRLAWLRIQRDPPELASSRRVRDELGEAHRRARVGGAHVTVEDAARATLDDATALGACAAVVLVATPDGFGEVASAGLLPHTPLLAAPAGPAAHPGHPRRLGIAPAGLAATERQSLGWYELDLRDTGTAEGLLVFALPARGPHPDVDAYRQLGQRGAVAIATAQSLVRLRELAIDRERLDLASQLQDEVAQSLVHVRMELELLAGSCEHDVAFELQRMVTVVQRQLTQVQATVADLRSICIPVGLGPALRQYARDLATADGPTIRVSCRTRMRVAPATEQGIFDIARTAMVDARRHVGTTRIAVVVDEVHGHLRVAVEDDGLPVHDPSPSPSELLARLHGLASGIGATINAVSTPERGSRVEILCRDPDSYLVMP